VKSILKMRLKIFRLCLSIAIIITVFIIRFSPLDINDLSGQSISRRSKDKSEFDFGIRNRMQIAIGDRWDELGKALSLGDTESAQKILNEINSYQGSEKALSIGKVLNVLDFISSSEYKGYRAKASSVILNGGYTVEMFFAGAATRLKNSLEMGLGKDAAEKLAGPMYFVDIWEIAEALGYNIPREAIKGLGMGQRQFIQLDIRLTKLAQEEGVNLQEVLQKQKIIVHINSEIEDKVRKDLVQHKFYGFNPANIIIVVQPVLPGYILDKEGNVIIDEDSKRYPYGHGYALKQIAEQGIAYTVDENNNKIPLNQSALDYLIQNRALYLDTFRVNDLTKLTGNIIDLDKLAYSLYLMDKGYNIVAQIVYNLKEQQGAVFLMDGSGKQFFLEHLASDTKALQRKLAELNSAVKKQKLYTSPNNVTRILFNLKELSRMISFPLPVYLRIRDENKLYSELLSGDVTRIKGARTAGIMEGEEFIQDFKELKDLELAIKYLILQDSDENFKKAARSFSK